jgi:two-component system response regulator HydG
MIRLLLVEDDITFSQILTQYLSRYQYAVTNRSTIKSAKEILETQSFDIILLDYRLPDGDGLGLLQYSRQVNPDIPVIIMTSLNDIRLAIRVMKSGAFDYITKPVNQEELLMVLQDALIRSSSLESSQQLLPKSEKESTFVEGKSPAAQKMYQYLNIVAPTDMTVMLQGESGSGKEIAARYVHTNSNRKSKSFIAVDCGTLTQDLAGSELFGHVKGAFTGALQDKKGKIELANGGTLFLDEVGNLSPSVQQKLLRALQERAITPLGSDRLIPVDIRIITATHEHLQKLIKEGKFREDLYFRLNEFEVSIPPLRERLEDLDTFISFFIEQSNIQLHKSITSVAPDVRTILEQYDWPGNIRELKNVIKRAVLLSSSEIIPKDVLPLDLVHGLYEKINQGNFDLKELNQMTEKEMIVKILQDTKYNKSQTAKILGIDRKTLYNKMEKYNIQT